MAGYTAGSPDVGRLGALDVLVVGGGIAGACIARELARRGLAVAIAEREDFGGGATANCLKIVHGGLRYLQHLDLRRMRESIAARSAWLRAAPHLVEPLPVLIPTRRAAFPPRWMLAGALAVNELASFDRNRGMPAGQAIPRARVLSAGECAALVPELEPSDLTGGVLFHDAILYSPERVALEVVESARAAGAVALNHTELVGVVTRSGRVAAARLRDRLSGVETEVETRWIVNAAGSGVDDVARRLLGHAPRTHQHWSVALNFVTSRPARLVAYAVAAGAGDPDRMVRSARQVFVVPWRGQTMIGTAHLPWQGDAAAFELRDEHIDAFLAELAHSAPPLGITRDEIRLVHRGLLPASEPTQHGAGVRLLKRHQLIDHAEDGVSGALSVVTVKFTTAALVARDVARRIAGDAGDDDRERAPLPPLPGAAFESLDVLRRDAAARVGSMLPGDVLEHLVRTYGARYAEVLALRDRLDDWDRRVVPDAPVIRAQLLHGVLAEHARTADDLLWRRTELGPRGLVTTEAQRQAEAVIASQDAKTLRSPTGKLTRE